MPIPVRCRSSETFRNRIQSTKLNKDRNMSAKAPLPDANIKSINVEPENIIFKNQNFHRAQSAGKLQQKARLNSQTKNNISSTNSKAINNFQEKINELQRQKRLKSATCFEKLTLANKIHNNSKSNILFESGYSSHSKKINPETNHQKQSIKNKITDSNHEDTQQKKAEQKQQGEVVPHNDNTHEKSQIQKSHSVASFSKSGQFNPSSQLFLVSKKRRQNEKDQQARFQERLKESLNRKNQAKGKLLEKHTFFVLQKKIKANSELQDKMDKMNELIYRRMVLDNQREQLRERKRKEERFVHENKMMKINIERKLKKQVQKNERERAKLQAEESLLESTFKSYVQKRTELEKMNHITYRAEFLKARK